MLSAEHGTFTDVVAMDSLIHYPMREILDVVAGLARRTSAINQFHLRAGHAAPVRRCTRWACCSRAATGRRRSSR